MRSTEEIKAEIEKFLSKPLPLWENKLTHQLVEAKYAGFSSAHPTDRQSYTTAGALSYSDVLPSKQFLASYDNHIIYMEKPDKILSDFYDEHGLEPLNERSLILSKAASKLKAALNILNLIPECAACVAELVNCIQVVASQGAEYDTSYSHPALPFTIFVSVCDDDSLNGKLRVAESILHESMHLKLSLIQENIRLIKRGSIETFYSPWRFTQRPLMGVMHGIFVFRAIRDFFKRLLESESLDNQSFYHLLFRISEIDTDFQTLENFCKCEDLTIEGLTFYYNLLIG